MTQETGDTVRAEPLKDFCTRVFEKMGVPHDDAEETSDVLVLADLRGIDSHGVARLKRYVDGLRDGVMLAKPKPLSWMGELAWASRLGCEGCSWLSRRPKRWASGS
jgi:LDH2 family malate/lactate/ureidoglycolate dehydrogenase